MSETNTIYPEASALRALAEHCSETLGQVQNAQTPECPAAGELAGAQGAEFLETAFSQGALLASVAREQSEALARVLTAPVLSIAPWPISRNVLEASAIGAWLWEPTIGAHERIARSLAFRYEGLEQQVKAVRSFGKDISGAEARLHKLEEQGKVLGYDVIHNKKGKRIGVARVMPAVTDLVSDVLNAETNYRLLSAVVHGHSWALIQLGFQDAGPGKSQVVGRELREFRKASPRVAVKWACSVCGDALHKLHAYRAELFGVETAKLDSAFELFHEQVRTAQANSRGA